MDYSLLLPPSWEQKIDEWLHEDIPSFDYGGFVVGKFLIKIVNSLSCIYFCLIRFLLKLNYSEILYFNK